MGYYMQKREGDVFIAKEDQDKALQAIKDLVGKETITDSSGSHFSWVNTHEFLKATTLSEALIAWRWETELDDEDNIIDLYFNGEKYGDDGVVFAAIAPYVKAESYMEMSGEDGAIWRWIFDGQSCAEKYPTISWD